MSARDESVTFVISVAAELAGMHPQTLRQYDRLGLVTPIRTKGRGRRYTRRDVQRLREVQRLSQEEGINLAGIQRILELENEVEALRAQRDALVRQVGEYEQRRDRVFAASPTGEVQSLKRGERLGQDPQVFSAAHSGTPRSGAQEMTLRRFPWPMSAAPHQRVRAVIEASPAGVRIVEGTVSVVSQDLPARPTVVLDV